MTYKDETPATNRRPAFSPVVRLKAAQRLDATNAMGSAVRALSGRVPVVRSLTDAHKREILPHLCELSLDDLWLRFGVPMNPSALERYVNGIDLSTDTALGVYNAELKLIGFTHVAVDKEQRFAELGLSVLQGFRRRGYGEAMLRQALRHAAHRELDKVYVYILSENYSMMRLARKARFDIAMEGSQAVASKAIENSAWATP